MSHTALVKFAPIFTLERFDDHAWNRPGRTLYERGAFQFLPGKTTVPLLVDHEDSREIGTVHELFRMDWIDRALDRRSRHVDRSPLVAEARCSSFVRFQCVPAPRAEYPGDTGGRYRGRDRDRGVCALTLRQACRAMRGGLVIAPHRIAGGGSRSPCRRRGHSPSAGDEARAAGDRAGAAGLVSAAVTRRVCPSFVGGCLLSGCGGSF
jgi:hypothetical protein